MSGRTGIVDYKFQGFERACWNKMIIFRSLRAVIVSKRYLDYRFLSIIEIPAMLYSNSLSLETNNNDIRAQLFAIFPFICINSVLLKSIFGPFSQSSLFLLLTLTIPDSNLCNFADSTQANFVSKKFVEALDLETRPLNVSISDINGIVTTSNHVTRIKLQSRLIYHIYIVTDQITNKILAVSSGQIWFSAQHSFGRPAISHIMGY